MEELIIVLYGRKSKFTEKGDSVENQLQFCKDYANIRYVSYSIKYVVFEDEGFSAATTARPQFQKMLQYIKSEKVDILMCYRLDRISRNVADFSDTLELLEKLGVSFVSATENFDTSTPMGKAMIYIASVFAQLERETIAERVRDNMLALAKTGRWLGGITPLGYRSQEAIFIDSEYKERKLYNLIPDEDGLKVASLLFAKYLEYNSLSQVESYCLSNHIKTQNSCDFSKGSISMIISNPVYCVADRDAYDYFSSLGCNICNDKSEFNGKHGLMCYNRTSQKKGYDRRNPSDWIVAIGKHKGIISGSDYIKIQENINHNKNKGNIRSETSNIAALSGVIECAKCKSKLRIKSVQRHGDRILFYYSCEMKVLSKGSRCDIKNLPGYQFEQAVINAIKNYLTSSDSNDNFKKYLKQKESLILSADSQNDIALLEEEYQNNTKMINNLLEQLSNSESAIVAKYVTPKLEDLDRKQNEIKSQIEALRDKEKYVSGELNNINILHQNLINFNNLIDTADINQRKYLLRTLIKKITWDGETAGIELFDSFFLHYGNDCRGDQYGGPGHCIIFTSRNCKEGFRYQPVHRGQNSLYHQKCA